MSWLARSLANSVRLDDEDDDETDVVSNNRHVINNRSSFSRSDDPSPSSPTTTKPQFHGIEPEIGDEDEDQEALTRGVKEDLSEIKQVLTRQLWGVASFLAPPAPPPPPADRHRDRSSWPSDRADPPPEMAWEEEESEDESFVGVTDEVLAFARNIAMHPETWLDFPLDEEDDLDDFDMSDAQREHVMEIERLAPRLMALRIELCPCHMSEGYFWKVYFVLLHSRLNKTDAEALSTPQVMAARAKWMQELHSHTTSDSEWFGSGTSCLHDGSDFSHEDHIPVSPSMAHYEDISLGTFPKAFESEKHPVESSELQYVDKAVIEEKPVKSEDKGFTVGPSYNLMVMNHEDDEDDDWPEEDYESNEYSRTSIHVGNEEDISFSDLEDDDFLAPTKLKVSTKECEAPIEDR